MRFVFAADVLQDPQYWHHLDRILATVDDGWHEWQIDDPELFEASPWLRGGNRPLIRKVFEQAAVRSAYPSRGKLHRKIWLVSLGAQPRSLAPSVAARFFGRPLCVCMENRFTDGLFLDSVLALLAPDELRDFLESCTIRPIVYDGGGGIAEIPKIVEAHVQESADLELPPRAVAFADSDARFPGDVNVKAREVAQLCQKHNIPCIILSKRAIENYIPDAALQGWAAGFADKAWSSLVAGICRLTREQRDHLRMKSKFPQQFQTSEEQALFASISPDDVKILQQRGCRGDLIDCMKTQSHLLSAETLRERDGKGELDQIVEMIIEAL